MMTVLHPDPRVNEYLDRLDSAAAGLPPAGRAELMTEIREHIDSALQEAGRDDKAAVHNVLERLGPPEEIVAAAGEAPAEARAARPSEPGALEVAGLVALIVPVIGWIAGSIVVALSPPGRARRSRSAWCCHGPRPS